jgi:hypothetical protein
VEYNESCNGIQRTCIDGVLDGDTSYDKDVCTVKSALNCSAISYDGYTIPAMIHNEIKQVIKTIT